jgi:hypothetical protein
MRFRSLLLSSLLAAAPVPALAVPIVFVGDLTGPNEEPPVASDGTGTTTVTIDPDAHTMRVEVTFSALEAVTTVAHIHVINGPGDTNTGDTVGPVATTVPSFPSFPAGVLAGTYDMTFDTTMAGSYNPAFVTNSGGTTAQAEAELFDAIMDGRAYLNVHSQMFMAGEIRDFLVPVPEPGAALLLVSGMAALGAFPRRRRGA